MKTAALFAVLMLAAPGIASGAFVPVAVEWFPEQHQAPDARSVGLGLAFTAVAEGPAASYWNPAAQLEGIEASAGWHTADQLVEEREFRALSASAEIGYLRLGVYEVAYIMDDAPMGTAYDPDRTVDARSHVRAGGLSLDAGRLLFGDETPLFAGVGATVKSFRTSWDDDTLAEADDRDYGAVLGGRRFLGDSDDVHRGWIGLKVAGVLVNAGRNAVEIPGEDDGDKTSDVDLVQHSRLGLALEGRHGWHHQLGHVLRWLVAADLEKTRLGDDWSDETLTRYGAELTLYGLVSGRVGHLDRGEGHSLTGVSYGAGLRIAPLGRPFGVRGDWASVPYDSERAGFPIYETQRLDRFSVAVWLDL